MQGAPRANEIGLHRRSAPPRRSQRPDTPSEQRQARLARALLGLPGRLGIAFDRRAIRNEPTDFRMRAERRDPIARVTVYALNGAVMVFFFPLGFALLIFNILGGENLRTTSHVLALTGVGMALAATGSFAVLH